MMGPFIDTIVVCSLTAFVILSSGSWRSEEIQGVSLTTQAFEAVLGDFGKMALVAIVLLFGITTMFGYSYYGRKSFSYLFGAENGRIYEFFYLVMLFVGAVWSAGMVVNLIDTTFAMMALPNMLAVLLLAPKVMEATRDYFSRYRPR